MVLRAQYCNGDIVKGEKETMLFLIFETDEGEEALRVPLYLSAEAKSLIPSLKTSFKKLPDLLKMIYNSGLKQEKLDIKIEEIQI